MKRISGLLMAVLLLAVMACGGSDTVARAPLSSAKAITAYSISGVAGTIDEAGKTIDVTMPFGTNVTGLVAIFTTTGSSVRVGAAMQVSGTTANNFTNPVVYTVTAANSSVVNYTVTVSVPIINLPKTGQTVTYSPGDDGQLQKGIAWPSPRFTAGTGAEVGCVTDNLTGLMWQQNANFDGQRTWQEALDYIANDANSGGGLCGHTDWRLPNINELESLAHAGQADNAAWLNHTDQGFLNVQADFYWSSSTHPGSSGSAWGVNMMYGDALLAKVKSSAQYVWPVRAGQGGTISLPRTGQAVCFDAGGDVIDCAGTGQDGDLQKGVAWPSPRFTVSGEIVRDNLTGFIWTKDGFAPGPSVCDPGVNKSWQTALDYVACLNSEMYLGHNDWRLPNKKELRSLINYNQVNSGVWLNNEGFTNAQGYYYRSATTRAGNPDAVLFVHLSDGYVNGYDKSTPFSVWPVRAGQ